MKKFESFQLDTSNECLWHSGAQIPLPPKPFAVLRYLVENPGRLITHDELLDALWPETYVQPQVLRTYMLDLRKALGDDAAQPRFIQTLPKRGYCFVAPVVDSSADSGSYSGRTERRRPATATTAPTVAPAGQAAGIIGRDEELALLNGHLDQLGSGLRRIVFVTGEAGIGKTAVVDEFSNQAASSLRATVARGQCVEGLGGKEQYYPVIEALGQLCASPEGAKACQVLARMAPSWLAALGREPETAAVPASQYDRMPGELCAALEELSAEKPLILVFEDLQWADESTLHLISALARRRAQARLMILVTYLQQVVTADHPLKGLKQDLLIRRLCAEIVLSPLSKTCVGKLLSREMHQDALPTGLAAFVHLHSEGNPLFVIAILEHLISQRFLVQKTSGSGPHWEQHTSFQEIDAMEGGVPDSLTQMIELQMERLTPDEQRLLEAGSLMNVAFPAWAVAAALKETEAEVEEACDALARRLYFMQRVGHDELPDGTHSAFYVFAHGLYREVLYQRQSSAQRARRHIRIAERLSQLFVGREAHVAREIAMHYEAAAHWQRAAEALRTAALHAQQRQAFPEAVELLEHALRISENLGMSERDAASQQIRAALDTMRESVS
jgi:predicted ATPase/DNA-binding winged helix-turn-helix (wHTH) protein